MGRPRPPRLGRSFPSREREKAGARARLPSKIDRDALLFPIAVAGGIEPLFLADGGKGFPWRLRLGDRRGRAQMGRRVEVPRAFHRPQMEWGSAVAKR